MKEKQIRVVELFAGVGGFRLGLETASKSFKTIWANQWEPNKKSQHAFDCYTTHFGKNEKYINEDISKVKNLIPYHDLLVGGFPCQDYSVARTQAKGIEGHKGVLWWDINDILSNKLSPFVLLENVDRLIKSPSNQRGRDFGVMLRCLKDLGYYVEWRIINAAEYGCAQKRRRTFIFAAHENTNYYKETCAYSPNELIKNKGFFSSVFSLDNTYSPKHTPLEITINQESFYDLVDVSNRFKFNFENSGVMLNGVIYTEDVKPIYTNPIKLEDILQNEQVDEKYFITDSLEKWEYLKGSKRISRNKPNGEQYFFTEGAIPFPDFLDKPARTMLTSESKLNRSTHVICDKLTNKLRILTPIECERLNGFPDNWTNIGMPESFRYFTMGNALVVPLVERMGKKLLRIINK